ncbi:cytochrome d ubiquinol oxidase subunit II [Actinomadura rupiterrae]|uniref:cytochrome d ubiquinol oxidase subunit II n=1 Tax=Actinomadura rupiterrae TaxID=559627 RepID=UPI0020A368C9|nr:cytochrome d ubiquinol oxidase subunit II [Actinomadura rupiterrae]MCP2341072.1 cytochrome d ubiquinol oxidase subunit II [Actinomadura rupiterrae]
MDVLWLLVVGLLFGGWLALDGFNIGVGLTLPWVTRPGAERRLALTAVGPFLLANEVWLVATAGVLSAGFPEAEGRVLSGLYPVVAVLLVSWAVRDAGFWFRSRGVSDTWRRTWEGAITAGSLGLAVTSGLVIGNLVGGVPDGRPGIGILDPLALVCAVAVTGLLALHGAVFLGLRLPVANGAAASALARRLVLPVAGLGLLTVLLALPLGGLARPWPALAIGIVALAAVAGTGRALAAGRTGVAFTFTTLAGLLTVLALGVGLAPGMLDQAAAHDSLRTFGKMALPVLPVLLLMQAWLWWIFRRRVDRDSVAFF